MQSALAVSAFHQLSLPRGRADRPAHELHFSAGRAFRCQSARRTARRKPSGNEVPGERTLSYFIAHEVTHTLIADRLGAIAYWRLPVWKDEGYADYVGNGPAFDYAEAVRRLRDGDPQMDPV